MTTRESKQSHEAAAHGQRQAKAPHAAADVDKTEKGPARLHAPPGRPRPAESGPPRLHSGPPAAAAAHAKRFAEAAKVAKPRASAGADTTESGPARLQPYRK